MVMLATDNNSTPGAAPGGLPEGIDLEKTPEEVKSIMTYIQGVVKEKGSDILQYAINKANPDRSFEDPKTIANLDLSKLTDEQKAAYYLDLQQAKNLNTFLGDHYGDNLWVENMTTGETHGPKDPDYPDNYVERDIDGKLKKLEDMGVSQILGRLVNNNVGNWLKENDHIGYSAIQSTFDLALFGFQGKPGTGSDKYKDQTLTDALTGLNTTTLLARTYLANDDFIAKAGDLDKTYHDVISGQIEKSASSMRDYGLRYRGEAPPAPGPDASMEEYKRWYDSLTDTSASKTIQPLVQEAFNNSDVAKKLKEAGYQEGSEVWDQYKHVFAKDATTLYNNVWGNIRKGAKLDDVLKGTILPDGRSIMKGVSPIVGLDAQVYRTGVLHTIQNATLAGALAGSIVAANGNLSDPQTIMSLTYASTNLADMLVETGVKYLDPKGGGFQKLGLNQDGKWTEKVSKYLPGGLNKIEAAAKMLVGGGSVVAGAASIWGTVNAIKNKDTPAAVLNTISGAGSVISGLATGVEGVLQWTNIARNFAQVLYPGISTAVEAATRSVVAAVGWGAGLVAGLGMTALGIYDMAKGVKVLDKSMKEAKKIVTPTTGWRYEFLIGPKL